MNDNKTTGEQIEPTVRLTQYSRGAGCGCKIAPKVLEEILKNSKVELNSVTTGGTIQKGRVIQPTLVSWLGNDTDKSLYSITDTDRLVGTKSSVGGSRNVGELVSKKYGEENDFTPISKVVE